MPSRAARLRTAGLDGALGAVGNVNVQGEAQQALDVIANELLIRELEMRGPRGEVRVVPPCLHRRSRGGNDGEIRALSAVERELCDGPAVYRYHDDDGLSGIEGGMLICTGWLVQALVACGRVDEAADWFDRLVLPAGPTGLLPEQIDPATERGLGNVPQAYSHLAVIDSALALAAHGVTG